jgi:mycothiol synthase
MTSVEQKLVVAPLGEHHMASAVLAFVRPDGAAYGLTRVDEADVVALDRVANGGTFDAGTSRVTFSRDTVLVGYASFTPESGDLAAERAVLDDCSRWLATAPNGPQRLWVRGLPKDAVPDLAGFGREVRRLAVCVRALDSKELPSVSPARTVAVRSFVPGQDDAAVVAVLARAYAGTPEGDWDERQFATRLDYPWFRADDLLLAHDQSGTLLGVHWLKRRDSDTGEVYNLAVDPANSGLGVGSLLLQAGLEHLAAHGLSQVVLWVDAANTPALALYEKAGFSVHTCDVQYARAAG